MITLKKDSPIPSVDQTLEMLRANNNMMPIYVDYDKIIASIYAMTRKINALYDAFYELTGMNARGGNLKKFFKEYAAQKGFLSMFTLTAKGDVSVGAESIAGIMNSNIDEGYKLVVKIFTNINDFMKSRGTLIALLQNPMSDRVSCDMHRMLELRPEWAPQNTGRVAMRKPALQNLPRNLQDIITVPRGYKLLHTDSGQVEPRITYSAFVVDEQIKALIRLYNDAYFGLLHYCTMPMADINSGRTDFVKMEITDDMRENRQSIKRNGNAVMYGSTANAEKDPIKKAMIERIGSHPSRLRWISQIEDALNHGQKEFKTYFGTPINIYNSEKLTPGAEDRNELIRLAINNPIQGTAADLMRVSCCEAGRLIMTAKDSYMIAYVHDAGLFCISEDDWDDIGEKLKDIVAYQVDDWVPVEAEADVYELNLDGAYAKYKY